MTETYNPELSWTEYKTELDKVIARKKRRIWIALGLALLMITSLAITFGYLYRVIKKQEKEIAVQKTELDRRIKDEQKLRKEQLGLAKQEIEMARINATKSLDSLGSGANLSKSIQLKVAEIRKQDNATLEKQLMVVSKALDAKADNASVKESIAMLSGMLLAKADTNEVQTNIAALQHQLSTYATSQQFANIKSELKTKANIADLQNFASKQFFYNKYDSLLAMKYKADSLEAFEK